MDSSVALESRAEREQQHLGSNLAVPEGFACEHGKIHVNRSAKIAHSEGGLNVRQPTPEHAC